MNVVIVDREPVPVAYLRHTGAYGPGIGEFWMNAVAPWMATNNLMGRDRFGISLDDPIVTKPTQCRYDACVEIPRGVTLPGAEEITIPGGRYAVTRFTGTGAEIGAAWGVFLGEALGSPGNRADPSRNVLEHYPRGAYFDPKTRIFSCELCLPLGS